MEDYLTNYYLWIVIAVVLVVLSFIPFIPMIMKAFGVLGSLKKGQAETARLMTQGRDATAKVLSINNTGTMVNYQPQVAVGLEVNDGSRKYQVQITTIISQVKLPQVQPGKEVPVKIDSQDPNKVVLNLA